VLVYAKPELETVQVRPSSVDRKMPSEVPAISVEPVEAKQYTAAEVNAEVMGVQLNPSFVVRKAPMDVPARTDE